MVGFCPDTARRAFSLAIHGCHAKRDETDGQRTGLLMDPAVLHAAKGVGNSFGTVLAGVPVMTACGWTAMWKIDPQCPATGWKGLATACRDAGKDKDCV